MADQSTEAGDAEPAGGPIFVVGCARSGTTLLQELLDRQVGIAIAPETHYVSRYWTHHRYGDLSRVEQRRRLARDITDAPVFREMGLDRTAFTSCLLDSARSHADVFGLWLRMYGEVRGASRVGEKTPHHLLHAPALASAFRDARFIHIVRDPRAVANSLRHVPWSRGIVADARGWRHAMRTAEQVHAQAIPMLNVRYEDLVTRPAVVCEQLSAFLGVRVVDHVSGITTVNGSAVNVDREPWKWRALQPVTAERVAAWETQLTAKQIRQVEAATTPAIRRWGYEPRSSLIARLPAMGAIRSAELGTHLWRRGSRVLREAGDGR